MEKLWKQWEGLFSWAPESPQTVAAATKLRALLFGRRATINLDRLLKSRHCFANKGPCSQSYGFSSGHIWMWELDHKECYVPKNWCFWSMVLEKTLESPLDCKEIKAVNPKGNQSWIFIGRTDVETETPILWPPDEKNWLIWKTLMLEKIESGRRGRQRMRWLEGITDSMDIVWVSSRSWWWTGKPGVLQFMASQRVGHDWATELNWTMKWKYIESTTF